jgi:uncharacterized damage-inducible protein DinB
MTDYLRRLVAHLAWADDRTLASLRLADSTPPKALELYAHILGAEHVWLARLVGRTPAYPVWPQLNLDECATLAADTRNGLTEFVSSLAPSDLALEIAYTNSAGAAFQSRIDDVLTQIVTHGCYHRGQIALLVREAGREPQPTDYIAFVRGVPAATRGQVPPVPPAAGTPTRAARVHHSWKRHNMAAPMTRSLHGRGLRALSFGFAALPFGFGSIRAFQTHAADLRYIWVALAALCGAAAVMAAVGLRDNKPNHGVALFGAVFVAATLLAVIAGLLLGTVLGPGIAVVGSAFGFCLAAGCLLYVLSQQRHSD